MNAVAPSAEQGPLVVVGEIRTCLVQNFAALPDNFVGQMLKVVPGQPVYSSKRPVSHATSPDRLTGLDCALASYSRRKAHGCGTALSHATVTGGRILQGSARACLLPAGADQRRAWRHYLARPGVVEITTRADPDDLAEGFLADHGRDPALDLGAISERVIDEVQSWRRLDHGTPLRARRTRVLWAAVLDSEIKPSARITLERDEKVRTVRINASPGDLPRAMRFCEDLALHDWLLTTVSLALSQADRASALGRDPVELLQPVVDQLVPLWTPGAHVDPVMLPLWTGLERHPGFTHQWQLLVARMRDKIAYRMIQLRDGGRPWPAT
ncbi:hypothetical protein KDK95_24710 [Actinospica sp. MGRD01-02]|uniref:Uncharacterized protein n=1 Tax=Actinospica acidithermotolerans TaxID=2828514 RepID=A0A941IID6_9ACTN|nr:SCO2521 family protein [Actinospica acidithermotolerans]MBR7829530.1 hypothetical protein [Actinospica acidithermotolerans]